MRSLTSSAWRCFSNLRVGFSYCLRFLPGYPIASPPLLLLPLHADGGSGAARGLRPLAPDLLAGLVPDTPVAADLTHPVHVILLPDEDIGGEEVLPLAGVRVGRAVEHPPGDLGAVAIDDLPEPVDARVVELPHPVEGVHPGEPGDGPCRDPPDARDLGERDLDRTGPVQVRVPDPHEVLDVLLRCFFRGLRGGRLLRLLGRLPLPLLRSLLRDLFRSPVLCFSLVFHPIAPREILTSAEGGI